jgi:hypothetical protein
MDPLSITVSVITLTEAVRRIIDLYKRVCSSLAITEEIDGLLSTVTLLGHALGLISSNLPSLPQESVTLLLPTIRECHAVLECMDELIQGCEASRPKSQPSLKLRSRMYWIKRADKIQKLKDRLNGHIFGLAFFFVIFDKYVRQFAGLMKADALDLLRSTQIRSTI